MKMLRIHTVFHTLPETENCWLEDDPFLLGSLFSGANCKFQGGYGKKCFSRNINTAPFVGLFGCQAMLKGEAFSKPKAASVMS